MESTLSKSQIGAAIADEPGCFIFCSSNRQHARWLSDALNGWRLVQQELTSPDQLVADILVTMPHLILLDFSGSCADNLSKCGMNMIALAQTLRTKAPHRTLVAVGTMTYPEGAIAALRAGISHFIDMSASPGEAREIVTRLIAVSDKRIPAPGTIIALLGARAGVGTTTLAVHLADLLSKYTTADGHQCRVCLLDLGLPAGDGQLYLNAVGSFHFADTLDNRHRLDRTLIQTAMTHSANGITIIPLPQNQPELQGFSDTDATALLTQLRAYFDVVIMDLGGHGTAGFVNRMANTADQLWLVTDQSAGALVSLAGLLKKLGKRESDTRDRQLILNRYDKQYGMIAPQIAERFGLPVATPVPDRTLGLMDSANRGKLLHEVRRSDPYVRAVETLLSQILSRLPGDWSTDWRASRWAPDFFLKRQRHKTGSDGDIKK